MKRNEIPEQTSGLEEVGLIAIDMDGTLLLSDHATIPQENIDAICEASDAGICVCISTGRMAEDASDFIRRYDLPCMIIAANGARIADRALPEGKMIYQKRFDTEDALRAIEILLPYEMMINGFEDGVVNTVQDASKRDYHLVARGLIEPRYGEENIREAAKRGIMKLFVVANGMWEAKSDPRIAPAREALRRALPHLEIVSSSPNNIEVMPQNTGKGMALAWLAGQLGLTERNVMAIGDAENDLSMLEYAYHSTAMGNACEHVKKVCRHETAGNDECGVAKMIRRVLEAKVSKAKK